jgi:hypothetical protein
MVGFWYMHPVFMVNTFVSSFIGTQYKNGRMNVFIPFFERIFEKGLFWDRNDYSVERVWLSGKISY